MRDGWREVRLAEVLARSTDRLGAAGEPRILTVTEGRGLVDQIEHWGRRVATEDVSAYKIVRPGDIVYNVYLLWNGAIGQNVSAETGVTSPVYEVFTPTADVLPRYIGLAVESPGMVEAFDSISIGTIPRRRRAPWQDFLELAMALPSLAVQQRVVDLVTELDGLLIRAESNRRLFEPLWWAMARKMINEVAEVPTIPLGDIAEIHGGLTKNKKDAERPDSVTAPCLRVANVHRRRLDLSNVTTIVAPASRVEASLLLPGDILMNEGGDRDKLGRGAVWRGEIPDCVHQNHVFRARLVETTFIPEFVSGWANSFGQRWFETEGSQTTGIASISKSTLSRFPLPLIPIADQQRWSNLLQAATDAEDDATTYVGNLRALRRRLLDALLSGEHQIPESYDDLLAS